jgi:hypothetical protein
MIMILVISSLESIGFESLTNKVDTDVDDAG